MPTPTDVYNILPIAEYLASNYVADKKKRFGKAVDERLPIFLYVEGKIFRKIFSLDPNHTGLQVAADYLYEAMGPFGLAAQAIFTGGSGGAVVPVTPNTPGNFFRFEYVVEVHGGVPDFANATDYNDTRFLGHQLLVFWNDIPKFLLAGSEWVYTPTGIRITVPGFDAVNNTYFFVIFIKDPLGTSGTTGTEITLGFEYTAVGGETTFFSSLLNGATIVEVFRGTPYQKIFNGLPTDPQVLIGNSGGTLCNGNITFSTTNPLIAGEIVHVDFSKAI